MAQTPTGGMPQSRAKSGNDVFTALVIIAFAVVLAAIVFVAIRSDELLGTAVPGITG